MKHFLFLLSAMFLMGLTPIDAAGPKQYRPLGVWCYPAWGCIGEHWEPVPHFAPGSWHRLDLSERVPLDAKLVALNALLILTPDNENLCYIQVYIRTPKAPHYTERIIWMALQGSRTNGYALVPVVNAQLEFMWQAVGWGSSGCSFGLNVGVDAYE